MPITQEQVEQYDLRTVSHDVHEYMFKFEPKPGIIKYNTITIGKIYKINHPQTKVDGKKVKILNFIYPLKSEINSTVPLGVEVLFLYNNRKGTYYNLGELEEVSE